MGSLLRRYHEAGVVGLAVASVMLAMLTHASSLKLAKHEAAVRIALEAESLLEKQVFGTVPRDPEYYRAKWRQIANDFYAKHPVERLITDASLPDVVTASLSDKADSAAELASAGVVIAPASHVKATEAAPPVENELRGEKDKVSEQVKPESSGATSDSGNVANAAVAARYQALGGSAIVASLAAGLLACWLFCSTWPPQSTDSPADQRKTVALSDALRLELPSEWVCVRPPLKQRLRAAIVAGSYVAPWFAIWTIVR